MSGLDSSTSDGLRYDLETEMALAQQNRQWNDQLAAANAEAIAEAERAKQSSMPPSAPAVLAYAPKPVDYSKQKLNYKNKAFVLCYHHFDDKENGITISAKRFRSHLQMLQRNDYNIITMEQFVQFSKENKPIPQNAILITMDDGYESVFTQAYPELKQFNMVATTFLVGDSIDHPGSTKGASRLQWKEIREMRQSGNEFFSHTYKMHEQAKVDSTVTNKPVLANAIFLENEQRSETPEEYKNRVKQDLIKMERRLNEELGAVRHLLAFPYGAYSETALQVGREAGFELFFTTMEGINAPGKDEIYRINAGVSWMTADMLLQKLRKYNR